MTNKRNLPVNPFETFSEPTRGLLLGMLVEDIPGYAFEAYKDAVEQRGVLRGATARRLHLLQSRGAGIEDLEEILSEYADRLRDINAELQKQKALRPPKERGAIGARKGHVRSLLAGALCRLAYAQDIYSLPPGSAKVKKRDGGRQRRWADTVRAQIKAISPDLEWVGDIRAVERALSGWEPPTTPEDLTLDALFSGLEK